MDSLPIIDFSSPENAKNAEKIIKVLETIGFMYLDNIPGYDAEHEERLFEHTKWFLDLPLKKKLEVGTKKYNHKSTNYYRGYFSTDPNQIKFMYKEGFELGPYPDIRDDPIDVASGLPLTEENIWPQPDSDELGDADRCKKYGNFRSIMVTHYRMMQEMSLKFLQLLSMGLGLPLTYFDRLFDKSISTLRLLKYPERNFEPPDSAFEDGKIVCCGSHFDHVFFTFLTTFNYPGLQVQLSDGNWLTVAPRPGSIIVNLGKMLAESTGWRLKATTHRVLDLGKDRYSVPFFFEPGCHAKFPKVLPTVVKNEVGTTSLMLDDDVEYITYGSWMKAIVKKLRAEYKEL